MTKILGVNIPGPVVPYSDKDTYPTHSAIYGKGGWKSVETIEELLAIPKNRLENGCIVRVVNSGNGDPAEFYFDEDIVDQNPGSSITDQVEKKVYKYGFRKWIPGYLPTKVSELENDLGYVQSVLNSDKKPIDPADRNNDASIHDILIDREISNGGRELYNEIAKAYTHRNSYEVYNVVDEETDEVLASGSIYGLVTVQENGKIDPNILENSVIYVVMLEGFFPDDIDNGLLTNDKDATESHPLGMSEGARYFITGNYVGNDPDSFKYKVATANDTDTWTAIDPDKNCIYINRARNEAYICEDLSTNLTCVGKGDVINDLGTMETSNIPANMIRWSEIPLSANMGNWLKEQIKDLGDNVIPDLEDRLEQEIQDRTNADNTIKKYTVNSIAISSNPVITGANAYLTGYTKSASGSVSASDTVNNAISKLEVQIDQLGSSSSDDLNDHISRRDNPHVVTRDQVGLGESVAVTFAKVTAPSGFFQSSDSRLKDDVKEIQGNKDIHLVQFRWKDTGKIGYGVIADELEKDYPSLVSLDKNEYKTVNYTEALTIKISQLEREIRLLKAELEELKNK